LVLVVVAGLTAGYIMLRPRDYSVADKRCSEFDVRPLRELFGTRPATQTEEEAKEGSIACGFRITGDGELQLGLALITIVAQTLTTPEQAVQQFRSNGPQSEQSQKVDGLGDQAMALAMPVSSDAPEAMTNHLLYVLDDKLLLVVSLQVFTGVITADQAAVKQALIDVAQRTMSVLR
jgi:hypothetical protein